MGVVYRVEHVAMGKLAAMKILHPALTKDEAVGRRFRREAETVSRLSHPNTVQVFDFGGFGGTLYLVMELVRGEDLGVILRRDGHMPVERAAPILMQVCDALEEAHEAGVIHRDLKPENILVSRTRDGNDFVKVLDFGLAKLRDQEDIGQVTARGALVGTPFYMSPEQIRCEDLDGRSDLYSLGAVAYRMLAGEVPFDAATSVAVLTQHLTEELVPPSKRRPDLNIHPAAEQVVMRAMRKARDQRYANSNEMRRAFAEALAAITPRAVSPTTIMAENRRQTDETDGAVTVQGKRLRREDIDAYERALELRRKLRLMVPALALVAAIATALVIAFRPVRISDVELEPNNSPAQATPIASDRTVRGQIGKKISFEESDRDYYTFHISKETSVLHAELTGLPTMDLKLEVFDSLGHKLSESNIGERGESEDLPNLRLSPGDYYLSVGQVWVSGQAAIEDFKNWYLLTAAWHTLQPTEESEPDDVPLLAVPCPLNRPMRGMLSKPGDVDYFRPIGDGGGTLSGYVSGIDGVDLRLVVLPSGISAGPPGALPSGALLFDKGGVGGSEKFDGVPWKAGAPAPLVIVERKDPRLPPGKRVPLLNPDVPYALTLQLH